MKNNISINPKDVKIGDILIHNKIGMIQVDGIFPHCNDYAIVYDRGWVYLSNCEDMNQIMSDYRKAEIEELEKIKIQNKLVLDEVKTLVSKEFHQAIIDWIEDEDNGIGSEWQAGLELIALPIGHYQTELNEYTGADDYWQILKGMWVDQSCGISGDDYHGTLCIQINEELYLKASFSL